MKTLVIGDIHLEDKLPGYLNAQVAGIGSLFNTHRPCDTIFLGDVFHKRKPTPKELLAFKCLLSYFEDNVYILRGNHDSDTKADDGVTALSLFEQDGGEYGFNQTVTVIKDVSCLGGNKIGIAHFENEETIKEHLSRVAETDIVFGHFGYSGSLNACGDFDFNIPLALFKSRSYLGHVHTFKQEGLVTIVGTPYPTNFQEAGKDNYYIVLDKDDKEEVKESHVGPVYLTATSSQLTGVLEEIQSTYKDRFVLLQVYLEVEELETFSETKLKSENPNIHYVSTKIVPSVNLEDLSFFSPTEEFYVDVTDDMIKDYIQAANTTFEVEDILQEFRSLKDE